MLPVFKRMESYDGGDEKYRGRSGPLRVTDPDESGLLYETIMSAAQQVGIPRNADYNGENQEGIAHGNTFLIFAIIVSVSRNPNLLGSAHYCFI